MKQRKYYLGLVLLLALVLGFVGAYLGVQLGQAKYQAESPLPIDMTQQSDESSDRSIDFGKVIQTFNIIKEHYIEDVDDETLLEGAIQGMLSTLEDPYSSYMDIEQMERFNEQIEASFEGIGAEVSMVNGRVTIVAPIKDSPAEAAGLRPNDQVLKIDGEDIEGWDLNEAVSKIRGEKGTEVTLEIYRPGVEQPFEVSIIRDKIPLETVHSELTTVDGKKTGIIKITTFSETTAADFTEQLTQLESEGIEGLVIDVRGNPGGLLQSVEDILEHFIPNHMPYYQIEGKDGEKIPYYSKLDQKKDYPISILIDEGSASASEILSVALKDMGYDVVGTKSFGKGTVQQAIPLGDGSTVKLTLYKWLSPKGHWIHETGVEPTIEQRQPDFYYTHPIQIEEPLAFDQASNMIRNAQIMLQGLGYKDVRVDGYFDRETEAAVKDFQQKHGLNVTGEIDEKTASELEVQIIEKIRNGEEDAQLEKALEALYQ